MIRKSIVKFSPNKTTGTNTLNNFSAWPGMAIKMGRFRLKRVQAQRRKNLIQLSQTQWRYLLAYLTQKSLNGGA